MNDRAEQELRELVEERVAAVLAKDPASLADRQHPEIVTFDVLPPLHSRGSDAVVAKTQAWSTPTQATSAITFTGTLAAGGEVDMCTTMNPCPPTRPTGKR